MSEMWVCSNCGEINTGPQVKCNICGYTFKCEEDKECTEIFGKRKRRH